MCVQMKEVEGGHMVLTLTSNTFFVVQKKPTNIFHNFLYSFSLVIFYIFFIAILIGGEFVFQNDIHLFLYVLCTLDRVILHWH